MPAAAYAGAYAATSSKPAAVGATHPRVSGRTRFTGSSDALHTRAPLRRRVRARGTVAAAEPSALTSSDGGGVAVVGLGARGCAVVDRLVSRGGLPNAQFWSLSADANSLQTALAPNRWRLPPGTVDPKDSAVEENAVQVARAILNGGVANVCPNVVVVIASASEAKGVNAVVLQQIAAIKDGPNQRGWFNVGGSQGISHKGPLFVIAAITPFSFEGPRKTSESIELLNEAQKFADAVAVVPQESLTSGVSAETGEALTVQEVTELADATAQWSAWTVLEMLRSPAWVGLDGAASESTAGGTKSRNGNRPWKYENFLSPETFRNLTVGRPVNAKLGCGAMVVGYGTSTLELNFAPDEGQAAAIREATQTAAETSPFLPTSVFREAEFVAMSVQTSVTLTENAVRSASDCLSQLVGVNVPQIVTQAKPDPRAPPDQILVTLLVSTQPEIAAARSSAGNNTKNKKDSGKKLLGMSFPSIPGMSKGMGLGSIGVKSPVSVETVGKAKREERELKELKQREEREKNRPAQKLTGDMLRKLGLGDPATMVEEHLQGQKALQSVTGEAEQVEGGDAKHVDGAVSSDNASQTSLSQPPPPLPMPPKRETKVVAPGLDDLPMPSAEDVASAVRVPETKAEAGAKPSDGAPKVVQAEFVSVLIELAEMEAEVAEVTGEVAEAESTDSDSDKESEKSVDPPVAFDASAVGGNKPTVRDLMAPMPTSSTTDVSSKTPVEDPNFSDKITVPLPPGIEKQAVPVRILEPTEDPTGRVIGYKQIELDSGDTNDSDDFDDDEIGDNTVERKGKKGLFGWGKKYEDDDESNKDKVKNRLASVLDRDRSGATRQTVRLEYSNDSAYEGEWFGNVPEGSGMKVFWNGDTYEGRWRDGLPDGRGVLSFSKGGSFSGMFFEGKPNGVGVLDLSEELVDGRWVDGVLTERWDEQDDDDATE